MARSLKDKAKLWTVALAAASFLVTACSGGGTPSSDAPSSDPSSDSDSSIEGKRVLISPYWLDNFNTANTSWIKRDLEALGASVDVVNPNAVASKQLSVLETAVASQTYDLIIWSPVDSVAAPAQIRKIQNAKIPQVVNFTSVRTGEDGLNFSVVVADLKSQYTQAGLDAATYIKAHPELGPPRIAVIYDDPKSEFCVERISGLLTAVRSILPDVEVVYDGGAKSQADATSKMTDFITRDIPFNIFGGCGGAVSLGGIAAVRAAGLADADQKVPKKVYLTSFDGTPPELQLLWDPKVSLMRSGGVFPKDAAKVAEKLVIDQLTGKTAYNEGAEGTVDAVWFTPDCAKHRPFALEQFEGVEGFTIPECTFEYTGS